MEVTQLLNHVRAVQSATEQAKHLYRDRFAPDFTPFDFIEPNEVRLSSILAWFLDPKATHGQGGRFLRLLLGRLAVGWPPDACDHAKVATETTVEEGRLDIVVRSASGILVIENKPWAADQPEQLKRYFTHLDRPKTIVGGSKGIHPSLIYLTADGAPPPDGSIGAEEKCERTKAGQLHCWSYREHILEWLADCRAVCRADRVSTFIDEFARHIRKQFEGVVDMKMQDQLVDEVTGSPAMVAAAMQVIFAAANIQKKLVSTLQAQIAEQVERFQWTIEGKISNERYAYLKLNFSLQCKYLFSVGFEQPKYKDFGYGLTFKDKNRPDSVEAQAALASAIGHGRRDLKGGWAWWRASPHDDILPVELNWTLEAAPWIAVADGELAKRIVGAAHRVRDALDGHGLL